MKHSHRDNFLVSLPKSKTNEHRDCSRGQKHGRGRAEISSCEDVSDAERDLEETSVNRKKNRQLVEVDGDNYPKKRKKRKNRSAPTEMSSKKPVGRYRDVVGGTAAARKSRDPRFDGLCGTLNRGHWETAYSFIDEYKDKEINELKMHMKKVKDRKTRASLEKEIQREQTHVKVREKWKRRRKIVRQHKKSEREKIEQGLKQKPFFLKESDVRKSELRAKFDELKKEGRVEKFMQKRRKRNAARDRKFLPQ